MFSIACTQPALLTSPLRALHSLLDGQILAIERAVLDMPDEWSLERHDSYDGDRLVMLIPNDETWDTIIIRRSAYGFHLATNLRDEFQNVGVFGAFPDLMTGIMSRVANARNRRGQRLTLVHET